MRLFMSFCDLLLPKAFVYGILVDSPGKINKCLTIGSFLFYCSSPQIHACFHFLCISLKTHQRSSGLSEWSKCNSSVLYLSSYEVMIHISMIASNSSLLALQKRMFPSEIGLADITQSISHSRFFSNCADL